MNGVNKLWVNDVNFMTQENISKAVKQIKMKNSEGHDMIPQRLPVDGISMLLLPLTQLFHNIYIKREIPEQWKLSKILRIGKKHFNEQDGRFEQSNPVRLAQSEPHLFQTQIKGYFYDLT